MTQEIPEANAQHEPVVPLSKSTEHEEAIEVVSESLEQTRRAQASRLFGGADPMPSQSEIDRRRASKAMEAYHAYLKSKGAEILYPGQVPSWMTRFGTRAIQDGTSPEDGRNISTFVMRSDL